MNILYYGFSGSDSYIFGGIVLFIIAAIIAIISVVMAIADGEISIFFAGWASRRLLHYLD